MSPLSVPLLRLPHAQDLPLPARATPGAAGLDLRAAVGAGGEGGQGAEIVIPPGRWALIPTGICLALPEGYEGQVRPRSGLAARHGVTVLNAPGTVDSDYRGEILIPLINHGPAPFTVRRGDRVAQLVIAAVAQVAWAEVEILPGEGRGGGFGSTGIG